MKSWQKWLLFSIPVALIGTAMTAFMVYFFVSRFEITTSPRQKYIVLPLYGDILENSRQSSFEGIFSATKPTLLKYILGIRKAKYDRSVAGIIIQPFNLQLGYAKIEELRDALRDFRESGKKLIGFLEYATTRDYYLTSACDHIFMVPNGTLALLGLSAEATFLKDALGKLGVEADFINIGKYKTAPDQYTKSRMSSPHRKMVNQLLDDIYQQLVSEMAKSHPDSTIRFSDLIDQGPLSATRSYNLHLVDSLLYWDQLEDLLEYTHRSVSKIRFDHYLASKRTSLLFSSKSRIALLFAYGTIYSGSSGYSPLYGNILGSETLIKDIRRAARDNSVKAIVLRIDSPGGSGLASDLVWREIRNAQTRKPFVVSMSDVAASGGYYIAMAADKIVAHPTTITGSIGVFSGKFNLKGFYDKIGVKKEEIDRGKNAGLFSDYRNFTWRERKILQDNLQEFYDNFTEKVSLHRDIPLEEIDRVAEGQVWSGYRATQIGLVDTLGSLVTAVKIAQELAHIPPHRRVQIMVYPRHKSILERLLERQITTQLLRHFPLLRSEMIETKKLYEIFQNGEILSLLPFRLEIE
jgi:protease-4